jgi:TfoX/Sxy family transcriptional regulator of competence genes
LASLQTTIDFLLTQISGAGVVSAKKMFGEYALYCDDKIVALVCDDQLFVKPTLAGEAFIGTCTEGIPYPGAKPYFLIAPEKWENSHWLTSLIKFSAAELPLRKKKSR